MRALMSPSQLRSFSDIAGSLCTLQDLSAGRAWTSTSSILNQFGWRYVYTTLNARRPPSLTRLAFAGSGNSEAAPSTDLRELASTLLYVRASAAPGP
jgi:hypothetical protein